MVNKIQLANNNEAWNANKRYKINAIVTHKGFDWQNTSGKNSEPGSSSDWISITYNIRPYKVYVGLLSQSGTSNPTVIELENTIGNIVWTRRGIGDYIGTLSDAFTLNKTWFSKPSLDYFSQSNAEENVWFSRLDSDTVNLYNVDTGTSPIDGIGQLSIEIRVYI
ncbi:MAG: hypothetical protein ACK518_04190 [bacterium]|jgi:hypothetical protein